MGVILFPHLWVVVIEGKGSVCVGKVVGVGVDMRYKCKGFPYQLVKGNPILNSDTNC